MNSRLGDWCWITIFMSLELINSNARETVIIITTLRQTFWVEISWRRDQTRNGPVISAISGRQRVSCILLWLSICLHAVLSDGPSVTGLNGFTHRSNEKGYCITSTTTRGHSSFISELHQPDEVWKYGKLSEKVTLYFYDTAPFRSEFKKKRLPEGSP